MRIYLSDPKLVSDLVDSLERWAWHVEEIAGTYVHVSPPAGVREDAAVFELDLYLQVWRARHPGVAAVVDA